MGRKVQVTLLDDIDGTDADQTLRFGLDGVLYEIDLSEGNAAALRDALGEFVSRGRRVGRGGPVSTRRAAGGAAPARVSRARDQAVRDWAKHEGIELADRGRIPRDIAQRYEAEATDTPPSPAANLAPATPSTKPPRKRGTGTASDKPFSHA